MAGYATLLLVLWTFWLLAALSLLPEPLPRVMLSAFAISLAAFPLWHAQHGTWRAYLMLWLAAHVIFAATAVRVDRRQLIPAAASAIGLLWIGFQGGGIYSSYADRTLLAALIAALLVAITAGILLLVNEYRIVAGQRAEERRLAAEEQEEPESEIAQEPTLEAGITPEPAGAPQSRQDSVPPRPAGQLTPEPSRVFAERVRVYVVSADGPSAASDPIRFMIGRNVTRLPDQVLTDLGGVTAVTQHAEDAGFKERLTDAAGDYVADRAVDPAFTAATRYWITSDAYPLASVADASDRLAGALRYVVSYPIGKAAAEIRIAATAGLAGISADFVLEPVTRPLAQAAQACEIIGVVVGVAAGLHPLAMSCAKMLGQGLLEDALEKAVTSAINDLAAGPLGHPAEREDPGADVTDWDFDLFRDESDDQRGALRRPPDNDWPSQSSAL
jgi:hypothetical protein